MSKKALASSPMQPTAQAVDAPRSFADRTGPATTVWELVRAHAERTPRAAAIAAPGRMPASFGDLDRHIAMMATALHAEGIERGTRVAVMLSNGPEMASACLAIASCATCVPLNPDTPAEQIEFLCNDLNPGALLLQQGNNASARAIATGLAMKVIDIMPDPHARAGLFILGGSDYALPHDMSLLAQPDDIALALYTSGTTARPKQVLLTHTNLCASARHIATALELCPQDRCLNVLPLFHVHGLVAAVLASLYAGGSVACTPGLARGDFFAWLDELHPTWYTAVPTMHRAILTAAPNHRAAIARTPLRFIRSSSAALPVRIAQSLERWFNAPVIEAYGMTEAAHQIATNPLPPHTRKQRSVGAAFGTDVAVMNDAGQLLASGQTGELVVRGPNVTSGYGNDDAANAASFTAGWFRTGDLGYVDADGYIFLTGRLKEIVTRGGEKLSLREVDDALLEHPSVAQAAAFRIPHVTLGEDVAAAIVLTPGAETSAEEIRAFLFGRLPEFKIPSQVVLIDRMPAGATGKTDRSALHQLLSEKLKAKYVAPRNDIEARLAAIFAEITGAAPIGVDDNFFALGGDSLQGFRALARIRAALRVNLSIVDLFRMPTVAQIARAVCRARDEAATLLLDQIMREVEHLDADGGPPAVDAPVR